LLLQRSSNHSRDLFELAKEWLHPITLVKEDNRIDPLATKRKKQSVTSFVPLLNFLLYQALLEISFF
jgi:hypothetical protein